MAESADSARFEPASGGGSNRRQHMYTCSGRSNCVLSTRVQVGLTVGSERDRFDSCEAIEERIELLEAELEVGGAAAAVKELFLPSIWHDTPVGLAGEAGMVSPIPCLFLGGGPHRHPPQIELGSQRAFANLAEAAADGRDGDE